MKIREKICCWLFEKTKIPYVRFVKHRAPWNTTREELKAYPNGSLGNVVGNFLISNNYQFIPQLENHDVYHVITGYNTTVRDEIALQYFFLGNGKTSLYLFGVICLGAFLFPEYYYHFKTSYNRGKCSTSFYNWDLKTLLSEPLLGIQNAIFEKELTTILH